MKRLFSLWMAMLLICTCFLPVAAESDVRSEDIVILYTNDVHTYIDGPLSYDVVAAIKKDLQTRYKYVILAEEM